VDTSNAYIVDFVGAPAALEIARAVVTTGGDIAIPTMSDVGETIATS
jgi:hypothetical protein